MKNILIVILLVSLLLVMSCAPAVSDQELQMGLENVSDEDLDAIIVEAGKNENPLAGQASKLLLPAIKTRVSNSKLLATAQAVKIKRLEQKLADLTDLAAGQGVPPIQKKVEGSPPDDNLPSKKVEGVPPIE